MRVVRKFEKVQLRERMRLQDRKLARGERESSSCAAKNLPTTFILPKLEAKVTTVER